MKAKAVLANNKYPSDDPRIFEDGEVELQNLRAQDLLVEVHAVSVNPIDVAVRKSLDADDQPRVLGFDAVGKVIKTGSDVDNFDVGDRVFYAGSYQRQGSNAEYQIVDSQIVGHASQELTDAQLVAMPLTSLTAYELLFEKLGLNITDPKNQDKSILIINGAGGVGSVAIQMAKLCGLDVIGTASNPESIAWVKSGGADYVVNHHQNLVPQVQQAGFKYVDYILALSNVDPHWQEIVDLIQPSTGIIGTITNMSEHQINDLKRRSVSFAWEWMFAKSYFNTPNIATQGNYLDQINNWLDNGSLETTVNKQFSGINAENIFKATRIVESGHEIGKVVLTR